MSGQPTRWFQLLVRATVVLGLGVVTGLVQWAVTKDQPSLRLILVLVVVGIAVAYLYERSNAPPRPVSPEVIKDLRRKLREQVRSRSYGARSKWIEAPLKELVLDMQ